MEKLMEWGFTDKRFVIRKQLKKEDEKSDTVIEEERIHILIRSYILIADSLCFSPSPSLKEEELSPNLNPLGLGNLEIGIRFWLIG